MMQIGAPPATTGRKTVREHPHNSVEIFPGQVPEWVRAHDHFEEGIFCPFFRSYRGHNLLGQDIQRLLGNRQMVEFAASNRVEQSSAFNQFIARKRKYPTFRKSADRVI